MQKVLPRIPKKPKDVPVEKSNEVGKQTESAINTVNIINSGTTDSKLADSNSQPNEIPALADNPGDLCKQKELEKAVGFDTPTNLEKPKDVLMKINSETDVEVGQSKASSCQPLPQSDMPTSTNLETFIKPEVPTEINPYYPLQQPEVPKATNPYLPLPKPET